MNINDQRAEDGRQQDLSLQPWSHLNEMKLKKYINFRQHDKPVQFWTTAKGLRTNLKIGKFITE